MRKKLFAILMSAMMMVTFMPSMAFATEDPDFGPFSKSDAVKADLTNYEHSHIGEKVTSEKVVTGECGAAQYVKNTYECGGYVVSKTKDAAHNYIVKEMELDEAKALVAPTAHGWIYDFVEELLTACENHPKGEIDKSYKAKLIEGIAHRLLGVTDTDEQIAKDVYEQLDAAYEAFMDKYDPAWRKPGPQGKTVGPEEEKFNKAFQGFVAAVDSIVKGYFNSLGNKMVLTAWNNGQLAKINASSTYCYFLVKYCDKCKKVAQVGVYKHTEPADLADCATSYVCEHCNKTITKASHFQEDAFKLIAQSLKTIDDSTTFEKSPKYAEARDNFAKAFSEYRNAVPDKEGNVPKPVKVKFDNARDEFIIVLKETKVQVKPNYNDLSLLANKLFFMDSSAHKLSVTSEMKACGEVYTVSCSKCGESVSFTVPTSLKHNFQWKTLAEADCSKVTKEDGRTGLKVQVCEDCGAVNLLSFVEVEAKHNYVDTTFAPTCMLPGFTCKVCENCDKMVPITSKDYVAPTGHDYDIEMVVEPACGSNGLLKIACKNCKRVDYYGVDHNLADAAVKVSSLKDVEETWDNTISEEATTLEGLFSGIVNVYDSLHEKDHYYFVGYNLDLLKAPIELTDPAKAGHKFTGWGIAADATCAHGTVWAPKCSKCGFVDTNFDLDNQCVFEDEASKLEHNYKTYEYDKTCDHEAGILKVCQNCGDTVFNDNYGNELKGKAATRYLQVRRCVSDNEWTTVVEPTFTQVGLRATHCVKCGGICVREDVGVKKLAKAYQPTLKAGKKQFTVKFKNASKAATGYQIAYKVSGANNYKYVKTTFKNSKTVKNLKAGKKYTVKVRAYVEEAGKTVYGKWCAVKYVKVK